MSHMKTVIFFLLYKVPVNCTFPIRKNTNFLIAVQNILTTFSHQFYSIWEQKKRNTHLSQSEDFTTVSEAINTKVRRMKNSVYSFAQSTRDVDKEMTNLLKLNTN